jgi:urease gamma subunit
MVQCNEEAVAMITPAVQKDARKMKKVEDTVLKCMSRTVDENIKHLGPMKHRIEAGLKEVTK